LGTRQNPDQVKWAQVATEDGLRLDGWLHTTDDPVLATETEKGPVALIMHGAGANGYGSSLINRVGSHLHKAGWPVLRCNNRGHDGWHVAFRGGKMIQMGSAFERLHESEIDINAWTGWLTRAGYGPIWLVAHSLGSFKSLYWAARNQDNPSVAGIVSISPPCLSQKLFSTSNHASVYIDMVAKSKQLISTGRESEVFWAEYPFKMLLSPGCYMDKYVSGEKYNFNSFAHQINLPVYWMFGQKELDDHHALGKGVEILKENLPAGHDFKIIPDADHFFTGYTRDVCQDVKLWLDRWLASNQPV